MKIIVRGDCCSRRAVQLNRDLFGGKPTLLCNEKAANYQFVDTLQGKKFTYDDLTAVMDTTEMPKSLATYVKYQADRTTLDITDADLIIMDSYSDLNFQLWQSKERGWSIWVHPRYIRDWETFESDFVSIGYRTLEQAVEDNIAVITAMRERNGHIPILYFTQPLDWYPKLYKLRSEFNYLGDHLTRRVDQLYWGGVLSKEDLDPDWGSGGGPENMLHFKGPTYRKMITRAMQGGLRDALDARIATI